MDRVDQVLFLKRWKQEGFAQPNYKGPPNELPTGVSRCWTFGGLSSSLIQRVSMNQKVKKMLIFLGLIVLTIIGCFFFILPKAVDHIVNSIFLQKSSIEDILVPEIHKSLFIADLHADTLLWDRPLLKTSAWGHVDLPRLQKGHVALQAFSVVTQTPLFPNVNKNSKSDLGTRALSVSQLWPMKTWTDVSERALYQSSKLKKAIAESNGELRLILNHQDLIKFREDWQRNPKLVAGWLTMEGTQALEGDLSFLGKLFEEGFRMIGPAHLFDNEWSGSQSGVEKYGLTAMGKKWVLEMNRRKMIIDLAHLSPTAFDEVLELSRHAPIVSHTGVQAICAIPRNLSDSQIKKVAAHGGLIGIGLWKEVLCGENLSRVVKSIRHICNLVGCRSVAIGSDWDGFVSTATDAEHIGLLTAALVQDGFSQHEIQGIMGENTFRFLIENLP